MAIVWGRPENPGEMIFKSRSNLLSKDGARRYEYHVVHPIERWFGITFGDGLFMGVVLFRPCKSRIIHRRISPEAKNHGETEAGEQTP